jgi:hypothetical protein
MAGFLENFCTDLAQIDRVHYSADRAEHDASTPQSSKGKFADETDCSAHHLPGALDSGGGRRIGEIRLDPVQLYQDVHTVQG